MATTLDETLAEATKNDRVCPTPAAWMHLYLSLATEAGGRKPSLPLIMADPALQSSRMREHLEWAAAHGCLDAVAAFLHKLPEDKWVHAGRTSSLPH